MKHLGKSLIFFACIMFLQTSVFGMDSMIGRVQGRAVGSKFPLTVETINTYNYAPTNAEIQFLHAIEKNALDAVKEYAQRINLQRGNLFLIALQIATQINSKPMVALVKELRKK